MELKEIKQILKLMEDHGLAEFTLERDGEKLIIKSQASVNPLPQMLTHQAPYPIQTLPPAQAAPASAPAETPAAEPVDDSVQVICSPMVGTFYTAPSPDSEPYARIGAVVSSDSTVCIIEAMKIMNEIKAELSGTITEICVSNGQPVEFGQALFKVKTA